MTTFLRSKNRASFGSSKSDEFDQSLSSTLSFNGAGGGALSSCEVSELVGALADGIRRFDPMNRVLADDAEAVCLRVAEIENSRKMLGGAVTDLNDKIDATLKAGAFEE